ncbi:DUF4384 domain-containing protein [Methylobacterium soli]|uniref:DUF4384 domain-containing protein n=1 Tax=Methylobacterium soli TaxID=553447 RepID=UPI00177D9006|nr:DUF4384 domain-containing protein [Methylobacterium soli]
MLPEPSEVSCELRAPGSILAYEVVGGRKAITPSSSFRLGARVVICVSPRSNMYISVWDTPPKGNIERLYPNSRSHPKGEKAVLLQGGTKTCIGEIGSGYQISISEFEGLGRGQFYFLATSNYEDHPRPTDFAAADWQTSMKASIENEEASPVFPRAADAWLVYTVVR